MEGFSGAGSGQRRGQRLQRFTSGTNLLPQVIAVAFLEANTAPGPQCQTPDLLWSSGWEPRVCRGGLAPPSDRDLRGAPFLPARSSQLRPLRVWGWGGCGVAGADLGQRQGAPLGGAWTWAARRPALLLLAPSPHSFVLARGSRLHRGPAAPPTRRGRVRGGVARGAGWGRRGTVRGRGVRCSLASLGRKEGKGKGGGRERGQLELGERSRASWRDPGRGRSARRELPGRLSVSSLRPGLLQGPVFLLFLLAELLSTADTFVREGVIVCPRGALPILVKGKKT